MCLVVACEILDSYCKILWLGHLRCYLQEYWIVLSYFCEVCLWLVQFDFIVDDLGWNFSKFTSCWRQKVQFDHYCFHKQQQSRIDSTIFVVFDNLLFVGLIIFHFEHLFIQPRTILFVQNCVRLNTNFLPLHFSQGRLQTWDPRIFSKACNQDEYSSVSPC